MSRMPRFEPAGPATRDVPHAPAALSTHRDDVEALSVARKVARAARPGRLALIVGAMLLASPAFAQIGGGTTGSGAGGSGIGASTGGATTSGSGTTGNFLDSSGAGTAGGLGSGGLGSTGLSSGSGGTAGTGIGSTLSDPIAPGASAGPGSGLGSTSPSDATSLRATEGSSTINEINADALARGGGAGSTGATSFGSDSASAFGSGFESTPGAGSAADYRIPSPPVGVDLSAIRSGLRNAPSATPKYNGD